MNSAKLCSVMMIVLLLISGCSSTVVTGSWKNPDFKGQVKKVYTIGISRQDTTRRIFEDYFRSRLASYGVIGIPSYPDLPTSDKVTKEEIANKAGTNGADAVMLARVVGKRTEEVITPGQATSYQGFNPRYGYRRGYGYYPDPYYHNYGNYYARSWETVYQPATITQYEIVTIEANLYDASTAELIWSAQLETRVEGNLQSLIEGFVEKVTKDMKGKGVI